MDPKDDIAISIKGVYKNFKLPHEKTNSLKSIFTGIHKKKVKSFEIQHALEDISFDIKKGEFFGIVGRNGSGKSTLLKIIAEIYRPTKGTIKRDGRLVPFIELGVGFNPELTGRENVYLNGALLGFSTKEIDAQYEDIVDFAELDPFMDQKLKNYSSGMQVRLAFSVATRAKADILLIDEVLAVGDTDFQRKCFNYFKRLKGSETTVIFVSHDMTAIREYCDRAVLIEDARIVEVGSPSKIAGLYAKLFTTNAVKDVSGADGSRWGDGSVDITDAVVSEVSGKVSLAYTVKGIRDVSEGLFGFAMKDASGIELIGTNSRLNGDKALDLAPGEQRRITHTFEDVFNDGQYTFDIAIVANDGLTVLSWWHGASTITIQKPTRLASVLNYKVNTVMRSVESV